MSIISFFFPEINACDSNPCKGKSVCQVKKPTLENPELYTCFCNSSYDNTNGLCRGKKVFSIIESII